MVVGAMEGRSLASLGRPRAILRCNVMCLSNRMQLVRRIHYSIIKLTISACHRQFIYTTYHCQSSLERAQTQFTCHSWKELLRPAYGRPQCTLFGIVATVIGYFSLLVTACHQLFTYHCLAPVLAGKKEHRLVPFAGKSEHHLDLVNTCFTPTNFCIHGSQVKVHPGARASGFRFHHKRTYAHTHTHTDTTNCKYRYMHNHH